MPVVSTCGFDTEETRQLARSICDFLDHTGNGSIGQTAREQVLASAVYRQ